MISTDLAAVDGNGDRGRFPDRIGTSQWNYQVLTGLKIHLHAVRRDVVQLAANEHRDLS